MVTALPTLEEVPAIVRALAQSMDTLTRRLDTIAEEQKARAMAMEEARLDLQGWISRLGIKQPSLRCAFRSS